MLSVSGLHLWRGERHVLRNLNLTANTGQCVLLTGRNGAGKTTLLRAIAGLLDPEEGQISWRGAPIRQTRDAFHSEMAYLGHEPALKDDLTGRENLRFSTGIRRAISAAEIDSALNRTSAQDFADRPARTLSAGQRRRVALAGIVLTDALLWLLDEPTTNLDADGQQLVANLIGEQVSRAGIVVAAVHHPVALAAGELVRFELGAA